MKYKWRLNTFRQVRIFEFLFFLIYATKQHTLPSRLPTARDELVENGELRERLSPKAMKMEDLFNIEQWCHISSSQQDLLAHCLFAREQHNFSPKQSRKPSSSPCVSSDNLAAGAHPETPRHEQRKDYSTPNPEDFKTPPEHPAPSSDVASGSGRPISAVGGDSVDLGFTGQRGSSSVEARDMEFDRSLSQKKRGKGKDKVSDLSSPSPPPQAKKIRVSDLGFSKGEERGNVAGNDGDTAAISAMADADKAGNVSSTSMTKSSLSENAMGCILEALRIIAGERGTVGSENDGDVDILETAKRRGMTFPRSRWYG